MTGRRTRVGVWGLFGRGNFGNEATLRAFLARLDPERFDAVVLCEAPEVAGRDHGVAARRVGRPMTGARATGRLGRVLGTAANRGRVLRGAFDAVRELDAIVIAGSGGLERFGGGAFGFPFEIWALALAAQLLRKPFALVDVGVQHQPARAGRFFVRGAVRSARYRSYRDDFSRAAIVAMGAARAGSDPVVTDLVFSLPVAVDPVSRSGTVVLGVMEYVRAAPGLAPHEVRHGYLHRCAQVVEALQSAGKTVRIVGGDDADLAFAHELAALVGSPEVVSTPTLETLAAACAAAEVVIAARYHTLVTALIASTPAISVGYAEKHRAMLAQLGVPDVHFDLVDFDPAEVAQAALTVAADREALAPLIEAGVAHARRRLDAQWPDVERVLTTGRR